jgi:hypothetical protein
MRSCIYGLMSVSPFGSTHAIATTGTAFMIAPDRYESSIWVAAREIAAFAEANGLNV